MQMEGQDVTDHHHHHHHHSAEFSGNEPRTKEPHGVLVCHRCGWNYPNPHPSAKQRRNHRKHCGRIEGFKWISSGDKDPKEGSSDDESSDEETKSTVNDKPRSPKSKALALQEQAFPAIFENGSGTLNLMTNEADLGKAGPQDSMNINTPQMATLGGKVNESNNLGKCIREGSEEVSTFTGEITGHGSSTSVTTEPLGHSEGPDSLSFRQKSNSFRQELPDADRCCGTIGHSGHLQFPAQGCQVVLEYPGLKSQNKQTDGGVVSLLEESILPVVEGQPESANKANGPGVQTTNNIIRQNAEDARGQQNVSENIKDFSAKLQDSDQSEHRMHFCKSVRSPIYVTMECNSGIDSRKVGIASILGQSLYEGQNSDGSKIKFHSFEETPVSALSELSQQSPHVYDSDVQGVFLSENSEQETRVDAMQCLECGKGSSTGNTLRTAIAKEAPQFLTFESENHKLPRLTSSDTSIGPAVTDTVDPEVKECLIYTQDKNNLEQDICVKDTVCFELRNISPIYREGDISNSRLQNGDSTNSDDVLSLEMVEKMVREGFLSPGEPGDSKNSFCHETVEETTVQHVQPQLSSKLINSDQDLRSSDGLLTYSSKSAEGEQSECKVSTSLSISEHDNLSFDPDCRKEEYMPRNNMLADVNMDKNAKHLDVLEIFHSKPVHKLGKTNSELPEVVQPPVQDIHWVFPGVEMVSMTKVPVDGTSIQGQILSAEVECDSDKKGFGQSAVGQNKQPEEVLKTSIEFYPASTANVDTCLDSKTCPADHGNSMDSHAVFSDANGDSSKSMYTCEPSLWEQLLESNVKQSTNHANSQDLGNGELFVGNPFVHEYRPTNNGKELKTCSIEGHDTFMLKQLNNGSTTASEVESTHHLTINRATVDPNIKSRQDEGHRDVEAIHSRKAPAEGAMEASAGFFGASSFMNSVQPGNHSGKQQSSTEIQSTDSLAQAGSQNDSQLGWFPSFPEVSSEFREKRCNEDLSADAVELSPEGHERPHMPLKSLLAEENSRGKDLSKPAIPILGQEVEASQNNIEQAHTSTSEVIHQVDTSSPRTTLQQGSNPFVEKMVKNVWSSPARYPSPKIDRLKVKAKSFWSTFLCCSFESHS